MKFIQSEWIYDPVDEERMIYYVEVSGVDDEGDVTFVTVTCFNHFEKVLVSYVSLVDLMKCSTDEDVNFEVANQRIKALTEEEYTYMSGAPAEGLKTSRHVELINMARLSMKYFLQCEEDELEEAQEEFYDALDTEDIPFVKDVYGE